MAYEFEPMRSLIFVGLAKEEYRIKLRHWLHHTHVFDSISQFEPYVTKYAFYGCLPTPKGGEAFGPYEMQLTEHYWLLNIFKPEMKIKALTEYMPLDVLRWQGNIPDVDTNEANIDADNARDTKVKDLPPFLFLFVPVCWEEDMKGATRNIMDGPNYRWMFAINYPEGVSVEEGDKWFFEEFCPAFEKQPEITRMLSSKILKVNGMDFDRVGEFWTEGPEEWSAVIERVSKEIKKPEWANTDTFPYLKAKLNFASLFLPDDADQVALGNSGSYYTMR